VTGICLSPMDHQDKTIVLGTLSTVNTGKSIKPNFARRLSLSQTYNAVYLASVQNRATTPAQEWPKEAAQGWSCRYLVFRIVRK